MSQRLAYRARKVTAACATSRKGAISAHFRWPDRRSRSAAICSPEARSAPIARRLDISERQACRYVGANRRMVRYVRIVKDDGPLRARLEELAAERRRFGFRRLAVLLRRDGIVVNIKRVLRIYREANLQVRKRVRRRVALGRGMPAPPPQSTLVARFRSRRAGFRSTHPNAQHCRRLFSRVPWDRG